MKLCLVQGFIGIDVAKPCQERLVEKQRFKLAMTLVQRRVQPLRGEVAFERFRAEAAGNGIHIGCQPDPSKLARIVEHQTASHFSSIGM